ncbi:hypothetical protein [Pseudogracilibacillus auburnensis]|uniref:hypothetical protein n=1 Tax=Pseudogracilibacillus auburnensis TaxID=1494959 RepID=UPI001A95C8D4|nr:hypothetical protein [Pseudogracilibacillus auburnensis]MBO1001893.1 hypothetical protein [Pseudogracilibacillus auburnensis]
MGLYEAGEIEGSAMYDPVTSDAKSLVITPYFDLPYEDQLSVTDSEENEIVLDLTIIEKK